MVPTIKRQKGDRKENQNSTPAPTDLPPAARLPLVKVPQVSQTMPPTQDQVSKPMNCGDHLTYKPHHLENIYLHGIYAVLV